MPLSLLRALLLFALVGAGAAACGDGGDADDTGEPVMDGWAGGAEYYFDNQTDDELAVSWTPNGAPGGERSPLTVPAQSSALLFDDGIIGVIPAPSDSLQDLTVSESERVIYRQDPIANDLWSTEETGTYSRTHTLVFSDELRGVDTSLPEGQCCCEFIVEGDIVEEDLRTPAQCSAEAQGQCIVVDPGRFTPHPCCPDATGERCGD